MNEKKVRKKSDEWRLDTFDVMIPTLMSEKCRKAYTISFEFGSSSSLSYRTGHSKGFGFSHKLDMNVPSSEYNLN